MTDNTTETKTEEKKENKTKAVINDTWKKTKEQVSKTYDSLAFWKKDLTEEEKLAKAQKKLAKIEKKYQKALAKAEKEQDAAKAAAKKAKAEAKHTASVDKLTAKYPDQVAQIKAKPELLAAEMAKESKWQKTWDKTKETTNKALNSVAFWKKKTPEEKRAKVDKKLDKMNKKYEEAMKEAEQIEDEAKRQEKIAKIEKKYQKSYSKLSKKYPDQIMAIESEIEEAAEKEEAAKKAAEDAKKKAEEEAKKKAAAENDTAAVLAAQANAGNTDLAGADKDTQDHFEQRVGSKDAVKKAQARVSQSPEERKLATLKRWMKEVNLPEENAEKMVEKYGTDMAYKLTQRCMLEPNNLMPEFDDQFKKVDNKSSKSIQHFLDLDISNADNKSKVTKVTGLEFAKEEVALEPQGSNKSNRFIAEKMLKDKQQTAG